MTTHLTSMLLWETLQTYHGSKDFRCGLVSLGASVFAVILFPPLSPPPSPRPIMDQRIKVWPCVSRCFCVCYHSLPSPSPPPPTYYESKDFRCGLLSLDASVSAAILFPPLPFYESPFFTKRGDSAISSFIIKAVCYIIVFELLMKIPRKPRACRCFEVRF